MVDNQMYRRLDDERANTTHKAFVWLTQSPAEWTEYQVQLWLKEVGMSEADCDEVGLKTGKLFFKPPSGETGFFSRDSLHHHLIYLHIYSQNWRLRISTVWNADSLKVTYPGLSFRSEENLTQD